MNEASVSGRDTEAVDAAVRAYNNGRANVTAPTATTMRETGLVAMSKLAVGDWTSATPGKHKPRIKNRR